MPEPAATSIGRAAPTTRPGEAAGQANKRAAGLDGVRALAVLAVLMFHENVSWLPGGFLGVDVFFVLSGYLITDLLVARFDRTGRVGLKTFWQRRARRLLPALGVMLLVGTAAVCVLEPDQRSSLRAPLLGAVSYTSNWWQALAHQSYFQLYGPPPPFSHLWSLAVEEQFYLLWPLILTVVLTLLHRPLHRALVAWGGALASALAMYAVYTPGSDPSFVYYGTFTHASALMIGSALALTWPLATIAGSTDRVAFRLDMLGAASLALLGFTMWHFSGADPVVYPFGLVLAALAAGGLVLAAAAPGWAGLLLAVKPLRWLGVRSYGIYLWHWPVIAITAGLAVRATTSLPARIDDAVLPVVLAAISWRWLESPILRNGFLPQLARWRQLLVESRPKAAVPVAVAAGMLAVTCTAAYGLAIPPTGRTLESQIAAGARLSATTAPQQSEFPWWQRPGLLSFTVGQRPTSRHRSSARVAGAKVIAIGDSVMLASAPQLATALPGIYINAKVSRFMYMGVALVRRLAAERRLRPVLVVALGTNGPITAWQIDQIHAAIGPRRWLLLVNTFVPRPWEHEVNETIGGAARRYPNVLLVNWHAAIEHRTGLLWSDGIHPQPVGGRLYARIVRTMVAIALRSRIKQPTPKRPPSRPPQIRGAGL